MILKKFKIKNRFAVENYLTFTVNQQVFQVFELCGAATNACHLTHGISLDHRKTCLTFHVLCSILHRQLIKEFFTIRHQVPQARFQCMVARCEERIGSTIPMPMFAGRPSTRSCFIPVDTPQKSMVGQQRHQISELQFDNFTLQRFHVGR